MAGSVNEIFFSASEGEEDESDYGSEFSPEEEEIVNRLLITSPSQSNVTEDSSILKDVEYNKPVQAVRVLRFIGNESTPEAVGAAHIPSESSAGTKAAASLCFPDLADAQSTSTPNVEPEEPKTAKIEAPDLRSPIERFRTAPMKSLSVTDLVSPAWCELQYWYSLKLHGRKRPTAAMKRGSVMHKELHDQIYTTVSVEATTKEDALGLRIWNVIQGLRALQETGQTRELEVWGTIDGFLVNGVIDELSFTCPDSELETKLQNKSYSKNSDIPADQTTIHDFFEASGAGSIAESLRIKEKSPSEMLYVCDVKTRAVRSLPKGAAFRPTKIQLMLYHYLLGNLATNKLDFSFLLDRYGLDGDRPFSDSFIAQIGSLNAETVSNDPFHKVREEDSSSPASQESLTMLLEHNSLSRLWSLMIAMFKHILPHGKESISKILAAEYRLRHGDEIIGVNTFVMDENALNVYLEHEMEWWKGKREAVGVVIEEAYKCKSCEFADNCEWRLGKIEGAREQARANRTAAGDVKKWDV